MLGEGRGMVPGLGRWSVVVVALLGLVAACSEADPEDSAAEVSIPAAPQVSAILAASEMVLGEGRFPFGLVGADGHLIEDSQVRVWFYRLMGVDQWELKGEGLAVFRQVHGVTPHEHADGQAHLHQEARGVYVADRVVFDEAGVWQAVMEISGPEDVEVAARTANLAFQVQEQSATLAVGDPVPPSLNPTVRDVQDLKQITTHSPPVPALYQVTVVEALEQEKPFVVAFTTPAFCVSRMCGPVTDVVAQLSEQYDGQANFLHIEPWRLNEARNEGRLVPTELMLEWRLPSEPWVFVVDGGGRVAARFEGLVSAEELAQALEGVLMSSTTRHIAG